MRRTINAMAATGVVSAVLLTGAGSATAGPPTNPSVTCLNLSAGYQVCHYQKTDPDPFPASINLVMNGRGRLSDPQLALIKSRLDTWITCAATETTLREQAIVIYRESLGKSITFADTWSSSDLPC